MGETLSSLLRPQPKTVLVLGLKGAGKTHMLHRMRLGEVVASQITDDASQCIFPFERIETRKNKRAMTFLSWDLGPLPQQKADMLRSMLLSGIAKVCLGLIFVVDGYDQDGLASSRNELHRLLENEHLATLPLLVFCSKMDRLLNDTVENRLRHVASALDLAEPAEAVETRGDDCANMQSSATSQRPWLVITTGEGGFDQLYEGMDWMSPHIT